MPENRLQQSLGRRGWRSASVIRKRVLCVAHHDATVVMLDLSALREIGRSKAGDDAGAVIYHAAAQRALSSMAMATQLLQSTARVRSVDR